MLQHSTAMYSFSYISWLQLAAEYRGVQPMGFDVFLKQSYSWSGLQLPKGGGCIVFLSPMHKKIQDSYLNREGGNPGNFGLSSQQ